MISRSHHYHFIFLHIAGYYRQQTDISEFFIMLAVIGAIISGFIDRSLSLPLLIGGICLLLFSFQEKRMALLYQKEADTWKEFLKYLAEFSPEENRERRIGPESVEDYFTRLSCRAEGKLAQINGKLLIPL
jgi:hypothetical protein